MTDSESNKALFMRMTPLNECIVNMNVKAFDDHQLHGCICFSFSLSARSQSAYIVTEGCQHETSTPRSCRRKAKSHSTMLYHKTLSRQNFGASR